MTEISDYKARLLQSAQGKEQDISSGAERLRELATSHDRIKELIARLSNPDAKAEDLINEKHYQGYRLINVDFDVADNAGYIYAFVTMKRPNTY